jgi:hypothetical protein
MTHASRMIGNRKRIIGLALTTALVLAGCDDAMSPEGRRLSLAFTGLEPLANGFHYEGWAITAGGPVSTGKFNVATGGALVTVGGAAIPNGEFETGVDLRFATAVVVTIEPAGDADAVPSTTKLLAGALANGGAQLGISAPEALGTGFASASGKFILATPTDGMNTNETSGIWFLEVVASSPTAGLVLPQLPAGWAYEGWAVIDGTPVTTGRFMSASGADASAPFSGPQPGPPFPGEDFLMNAPAGLTFPTSLAGDMAVVTVEPQPDDSPAPFTLKPLTAAIPANAAAGVSFTMTASSASFPTGMATIR